MENIKSKLNKIFILLLKIVANLIVLAILFNLFLKYCTVPDYVASHEYSANVVMDEIIKGIENYNNVNGNYLIYNGKYFYIYLKDYLDIPDVYFMMEMMCLVEN